MVEVPLTSPDGNGALTVMAAAAPLASRAMTSRAMTLPAASRLMPPPLLRRLSMSTLLRDVRSMLPPLVILSALALKRKLPLPSAAPSTEAAALI